MVERTKKQILEDIHQNLQDHLNSDNILVALTDHLTMLDNDVLEELKEIENE